MSDTKTRTVADELREAATALLVTHFEGTVPEVRAAEALVLDRLAELVDAPRVPLLGLSPWEACQTLFGVAGVSRPDGDGCARGCSAPLADA